MNNYLITAYETMEKNMKLQQLNKVNVKKIDDKLFLELPDEVINRLSITDADSFIITLTRGNMMLHKSPDIDIPEVVYSQLFTLFKGNDEMIAEWIHAPKAFLANKAPIEMLNSDRGINSILDLIYRLRTGDFS
ncbi:MAG: hypothetical protein ACI88H_000709 [Cocleimonas sp.]|jgi:hypothetical protein